MNTIRRFCGVFASPVPLYTTLDLLISLLTYLLWTTEKFRICAPSYGKYGFRTTTTETGSMHDAVGERFWSRLRRRATTSVDGGRPATRWCEGRRRNQRLIMSAHSSSFTSPTVGRTSWFVLLDSTLDVLVLRPACHPEIRDRRRLRKKRTARESSSGHTRVIQRVSSLQLLCG